MGRVVIEVQHPASEAAPRAARNLNPCAGRPAGAWNKPALPLFAMSSGPPATTFYKRVTFSTHLPVRALYHAAHFWIAREEEGGSRWRIGYTKFATRMLGEIVDHQLEKGAGDPVHDGEIIGSIEGFKAISDLYCIADGTFAGSNPALRERIELLGKDPYGAGWIYQVDGTPDARCMEVAEYCRLLDTTIDRLLDQQKADETPS
jgi:glycine cleavage system H protein